MRYKTDDKKTKKKKQTTTRNNVSNQTFMAVIMVSAFAKYSLVQSLLSSLSLRITHRETVNIYYTWQQLAAQIHSHFEILLFSIFMYVDHLSPIFLGICNVSPKNE